MLFSSADHRVCVYVINMEKNTCQYCTELYLETDIFKHTHKSDNRMFINCKIYFLVRSLLMYFIIVSIV